MLLDNWKKIQSSHDNKCRVECTIDDKIIFIEFDDTWTNYVTETYDGFLIVILPIAMRAKSDIKINGPISYKLYHNITNYVMKIISIMMPECSPIKIEATQYVGKGNHGNVAVGCGLSCGVDSLC